MHRASFTAADIKRAIKVVEGAGKTIAAIDFPKEGGFRIVIGSPTDAVATNEWDDVC